MRFFSFEIFDNFHTKFVKRAHTRPLCKIELSSQNVDPSNDIHMYICTYEPMRTITHCTIIILKQPTITYCIFCDEFPSFVVRVYEDISIAVTQQKSALNTALRLHYCTRTEIFNRRTQCKMQKITKKQTQYTLSPSKVH